MGWEFVHERGDLWHLVNETDESFEAVHLAASGYVVVGGTRNWTRDVGDVEAGGSVRLKFKTGFGANKFPPTLTITWTSDGMRLQTSVPFP